MRNGTKRSTTARDRRSFSEELKTEGVRRLHERRGAGGTLAAVARELDVGQNLLRGWAQRPSSGLRAADRQSTNLTPPAAAPPSTNLTPAPPPDAPGCRSRDEFRGWLRGAVLAAMDTLHLDALAYPTWSNPPRLIGDLNTPAGDNSQLFSPSTGFPAITVPMGFTRGGRLPAGLQLLGRPWDEGRLIGLAYSYEQATHRRKAPVLRP